MSYGDDWRGYVPPKDRGEGEAALPRGVGTGGVRGRDEPAAQPAASGARPVGRARLTGHKVCYVNADATQIVGEKDAKAAGLVQRGGKRGASQEWLRFHSTHEAKRWVYLRNEERAGRIRNLRRQVKFPLLVTRPDGLKEQIATWTCDFTYDKEIASAATMEALADVLCGSRWEPIVEDAKGFRTEIYKRSKAHFEAQSGIRILET